MKFVKSSVEIIPQGFGVINGYKHIEKAARNCYHSEDKITDESYKDMMQILKDRNHLSPLEHFTVYFKIPYFGNFEQFDDFQKRYSQNPYSVVKMGPTDLYVTTNFRVIVENNWHEDLQYMCEPTEFHEKRITVRMVCSIGISREANRHRISISERSTRYCNYSKDKFGNELTFVVPEWIYTLASKYGIDKHDPDVITKLYSKEDKVKLWAEFLRMAEKGYMFLINEGNRPQEARGILPLDTVTVVYYTATISQWKNFFNLRCAPGAHPDMIVLATELLELFKKDNLI